jgi:hypothetical protein
MNLNPPVAFIGYGRDKKTGEFYQKVCKACPDHQTAAREAFPLRVSYLLCARHAFELIESRLGENHESKHQG